MERLPQREGVLGPRGHLPPQAPWGPFSILASSGPAGRRARVFFSGSSSRPDGEKRRLQVGGPVRARVVHATGDRPPFGTVRVHNWYRSGISFFFFAGRVTHHFEIDKLVRVTAQTSPQMRLKGRREKGRGR